MTDQLKLPLDSEVERNFSVNFDDLHQLLMAVMSPPHVLREQLFIAQANQKVGKPHYFNRLVKQVNDEIDAQRSLDDEPPGE